MTTPLLLARLRAVHTALAAAGFEHAVGGAIALAVHTREPRFTADIDLNVIADPQRPRPMLDCLPAPIVRHQGAVDEIRRDGQTRLMWVEPGTVETPVDLFLPQHEVFHALVNRRAVETDFLGAGIAVISATDLIVFKALFSRSKDWVDIETLLVDGCGDLAEVRHWLVEILGEGGEAVARFERLARSTGRSDL